MPETHKHNVGAGMALLALFGAGLAYESAAFSAGAALCCVECGWGARQQRKAISGVTVRGSLKNTENAQRPLNLRVGQYPC